MISTKKCCLRQHIRNESTNHNFKPLDLSFDDKTLNYLIRGPNTLGSHVEEDFELFDLSELDETRHESGSSAILRWRHSLHMSVLKLTMPLDTQNGFAFLEALSDDVSVESLGRSFDGLSAHTGMKVRPSTNGSIPSTLQLLPGQSFYIGKTTLSLVPEEHSDLLFQSSGLPDSNLESYNYQVSQIGTPQRTARAGSTIMETPVPQRDHESGPSTPVLEQITGQAISGRKDSNKWPESPLKREVMQTVRDASELAHSTPQPEFKKEDEKIADAVINEPSRFNTPPKVKTEDENMVDTIIAKPVGEGVVDPKDPEVVDVDAGSECIEKSDSLSLKSRVHQLEKLGGSGISRIIGESEYVSPPGMQGRPEKEPRTLSRSPTPTGLKRLPLSVARVQPKTSPGASDQPSFLQTSSDSSPQSDDDPDAPVRKKARIATVSREASVEESQDSLQDNVISIKRGIPAPTHRPASTNQASSTFSIASIDTEPGSSFADQSANKPKQSCPTPLADSKRSSSTIDSDSRLHSTDRLPSESSFTLIGRKPRVPLSDWNTVSTSPSISVEPTSSMRSTRSTARDEQKGLSSTDAGIRIVFASSSSAGDSKPFLKFLSSKGVKKVKSVHDCTVLCVGKELKKTSKVILAVLLGKDIVMDSWVTESVRANELLSLVPYISRDTEKETEWGISLDQAIYRGKTGVKVLQDHTVHFTPSVKKELGKNQFDELKDIVKCAGATGVSTALPKKSPEETSSAIMVATYDGVEVAELQKLGWRVYVKDIVSMSVLRGKLDLESDEFLVKERKKEGKKRKR